MLARLTVLVLAIGLVVSRLGLIVHELVGHGLVALLVGRDVTGWNLHVFGGGWVGFATVRGTGFSSYLVTMGGIVVELLAAAALAWAARGRTGVAALAVRASAWALALHALWYLAAGTFHGFGDGWLLHRQLGAARLAVVIPAAALAVAGAAIAGRRLAGELRAHAPASTPRRQLAVVAGAIALGLGAHAALTGAELALTTDRTYQGVMRTAADRAIERELAAAVARAREAGAPLAPAEVTRTRRGLERRHRQLPVGPGLVGAMALAAAAGVLRSRAASGATAVSWRTVGLAAAAAAAATALVAVVDALAP